MTHGCDLYTTSYSIFVFELLIRSPFPVVYRDSLLWGLDRWTWSPKHGCGHGLTPRLLDSIETNIPTKPLVTRPILQLFRSDVRYVGWLRIHTNKRKSHPSPLDRSKRPKETVEQGLDVRRQNVLTQKRRLDTMKVPVRTLHSPHESLLSLNVFKHTHYQNKGRTVLMTTKVFSVLEFERTWEVVERFKLFWL